MDLKEVRYEAPLTQFLFKKASAARIPLSGTFELSQVCNFNCRMCSMRARRNGKSQPARGPA